MSILRATFLSTCLLASWLVPGTQAPAWKTFSSAKYHFSVRYPGSWHRMNQSRDVLSILNFPLSQRVEGVVLAKSGASITVVPATVVPDADRITTIQDWVTKDVSDSKLIARREVVPVSRDSGACTQLVTAEWESEQGPNTYTLETAYYCETRTGLYRVWLSHWRGDPKQENLQAIALRMALTLRSW
jgi:hypothetical protein